jgi:predicted DNA-binding mobile mystery protein A
VTAIRTALGMSQRDLARRLSVSPAAVAKLEAAERAGGITLGTLQHVAEALDCTVVYALVPRTSLQDTVDREAAAAARRLIGPVATTMALEQQSLEPGRESDVVAAIAADLVARNRVWR